MLSKYDTVSDRTNVIKTSNLHLSLAWATRPTLYYSNIDAFEGYRPRLIRYRSVDSKCYRYEGINMTTLQDDYTDS